MTIQCVSPNDGSVFATRETLPSSDATACAARAMIVQELVWLTGRPTRYGKELVDFGERATYLARVAEAQRVTVKIKDSDKFRQAIKRVAQNVVLLVAPWINYFMTAINPVAPAPIAGDAVELKRASRSPLVGERIARAFHSVDMPKDVFQNLFLDHRTTSDLIAALTFGLVNFTGSVGGGRAKAVAASGTFTGIGVKSADEDPGFVSRTKTWAPPWAS